MSRLAVLCSLTMAVVTLAAFVHHIQTAPLPEGEIPSMPASEVGRAPIGVPDLVPASAPAPHPGTRPDARAAEVTVAALAHIRERVQREVVARMQKKRVGLRQFSRRMLPKRNLTLVRQAPVARLRGTPRAERPRYVQFQLHESSERFARDARVRVVAHVRVDADTGAIEAVRAASTAAPREGWEASHKFLTRWGVRLPK